MTGNQRPLSITILACVYILIGSVGFIAHFGGLRMDRIFHYDGLLIELVELWAIVSGAFMLRGYNWARWLALAWIAFHVVISAFHAYFEVAVHGVFCAVIAWILFRSAAGRYFHHSLASKNQP